MEFGLLYLCGFGPRHAAIFRSFLGSFHERIFEFFLFFCHGFSFQRISYISVDAARPQQTWCEVQESNLVLLLFDQSPNDHAGPAPILFADFRHYLYADGFRIPAVAAAIPSNGDRTFPSRELIESPGIRFFFLRQRASRVVGDCLSFQQR